MVAQRDRVVIRHADLGAVDVKITQSRDSFLSITNPFIRITNFVATAATAATSAIVHCAA